MDSKFQICTQNIERALALLHVMFYCVFVTFPCGVVLSCIDSCSLPPYLDKRALQYNGYEQRYTGNSNNGSEQG